MTRIRRGTVLAVGALLLTLLAACSSSGSGGPTNVPPNTVIIKSFAFTPSNLSVAVGTKVTWTNEDTVQHTATGSGASAMIHSPTLNKGQSYSVTFTKAGTYSYSCTIHPDMHGTITVT